MSKIEKALNKAKVQKDNIISAELKGQNEENSNRIDSIRYELLDLEAYAGYIS